MAIPILDNLARGVSGIAQTAKAVHDVDVRIRINEAVSDLHDDITRLRLQISAITTEKEAKEAEVRALKAELIDRQRWDEESTRYRLHELAAGIFVYAIKPERQAGEPPHYLCQKCFTEKIKSIVQATVVGGPNYECHKCGSKFRLTQPSAESVRVRTRPRIERGLL